MQTILLYVNFLLKYIIEKDICKNLDLSKTIDEFTLKKSKKDQFIFTFIIFILIYKIKIKNGIILFLHLINNINAILCN